MWIGEEVGEMEDREALLIRIERLRDIVQSVDGESTLDSVVKELADLYLNKK